MFQSATPCFPWYPVSEELADAPPFSAFAPQGSPEEWFPSLSVCPTLVSQPVSSFCLWKAIVPTRHTFPFEAWATRLFSVRLVARQQSDGLIPFPTVRSALCKIPPAQLKNDASSWLFPVVVPVPFAVLHGLQPLFRWIHHSAGKTADEHVRSILPAVFLLFVSFLRTNQWHWLLLFSNYLFGLILR